MPSAAFALRLHDAEYTDPRPLAAWEPSDAMLFRLPHYGSHKHRDHLLTALDAIAPVDSSTDGDDLLVVTPALLPDGYEEFLEVVACCDNGVQCDRAQFAKALDLAAGGKACVLSVDSRDGLTVRGPLASVSLPAGDLPRFGFALGKAALKELVAAVTEPTLGLLPLGPTLVVGDGLAVAVNPDPPQPARFTAERTVAFDLAELLGVLEPVVVAAAKDETRGRMCGVHVTVTAERATFAASDTHRMTVRHLTGSWALDAPLECIVPASAVRQLLTAARKLVPKRDLARSGGVVELTLGTAETWWDNIPSDTPHVRLTLDHELHYTLTVPMLTGEILNHARVTPHTHAVALELDRADLLAAVRLVAIVSREDNRKLYFRLGERLELAACSTKIGRASHYWDRHEYDVAWTEPAQPLEIAFNADYVLDALRKLPTERVRIELTAPNQPGVIRGVGGEDFAYVLMPMHLV